MTNRNYNLSASELDDFISIWNSIIDTYGCITRSDMKDFLMIDDQSIIDNKYICTKHINAKNDFKVRYTLRGHITFEFIVPEFNTVSE